MSSIMANLLNLINTAAFKGNSSILSSNTNSTVYYEPLYANVSESNFSNFQSPKPNVPTVNTNIRFIVTSIQFLLVVIGSINLLVVYVIISRPYVRSITNVYLVCLCISNFFYLCNLIFVVATQLNDKSWPFNAPWCTIYHSMESTSKYSSVLFVVLLSIDRYIVMCLSDRYKRKRSYRTAISSSILALCVGLLASFPLFIFSELTMQHGYTKNFVLLENAKKFCIVKWPTIKAAQMYIGFSTFLIFCVPSLLIVYTYFCVYRKLLEGIRRMKKLRINTHKRKSYQRVTTFVLWTILFHTLCWFPFWIFNLMTSIVRIQISTPSERILLNVIHLLPYFNCALNPIVYAVNAKNFRRAFCSVLTGQKERSKLGMKKTAIIIRRRDSFNKKEKMLYQYVGESTPNLVLQRLVAAAAGCAEVAGVELELTNIQDGSAIQETITVSQANGYPDYLWPINKDGSESTLSEVTEAADHDDRGNFLETISRPISSARRSMISLASGKSMVSEQAQSRCSMIPATNTMVEYIRKESRRHTTTASTDSNTDQFLLIPLPFNIQMAKGTTTSNCHLELPKAFV